MHDLTGQRFGKLTVIEKIERPSNVKDKNIYYICKCDCGKITITNTGNIIRGHTKSCGCYRSEMSKKKASNLDGNIFGILTVIKRVDVPSNVKNKDRAYWLCKCGCGKEKTICGSSLTSGNVRSCGCLSIKARTLENNGGAINKIYRRYKWGAKRRNLDFLLSKEYFLELITDNCYYCKSKPSNNGPYNYIYNGIDRIDNSKGYEIGNVVSCCPKCNYGKHEMNITEFYEWIEKVYKYRNIPLTKP